MELREPKQHINFKEEDTSEDEVLLATLSTVSDIAFEQTAEENPQTEDEFSDTTFNPYRDNAYKGKKGKRKTKGKFKGSKLKCEKCEYSTNVAADLYKHQRKHSETKPFSCPVEGCGFSSRYPGSIKHHQRKHSQERPFSCDICKSGFKTKSSLQTHMLRHSDDKPFQCTLCPFRCKRNTELRSHHIHAHTTEKKFQCDVCGLRAKFKADLVKHLKRHLSAKDKQTVECDICGKVCRDKSSLKSHIQYMHLAEYQPSQCNHCGKMFKREEHLNRHIKVVHLDVKEVVCEVCGARFSNNNNKDKHMVTHDADRLNCCALCPYKGLTEFDLRVHIGYKHSDHYLVNFCRCCNKKFKKKCQLTQHIGQEVHLRNSETSVWKNDELFEYRLEPKSSYTKKSRHITCLLTEVPSFKVEKPAGAIQPFPVHIKQEPVDAAFIKTEPGTENETPIKMEIIPSIIRNIHAADTSAQTPMKRGRPRSKNIRVKDITNGISPVPTKRGRPKSKNIKRSDIATNEIATPKKRGRRRTKTAETNEPQPAKRQKYTQLNGDESVGPTWIVKSYLSDVQIKTEKEDSSMDFLEPERDCFNGITLHQEVPEEHDVASTSSQPNLDYSRNVPTGLPVKKRGRPKGSKSSPTKDITDRSMKKKASRLSVKKSKALKMKVKVNALTTKKLLKQKQSLNIADVAVSCESTLNSPNLVMKRKRGRPKGRKTKVPQHQPRLTMKIKRKSQNSGFEIEYDLTEDPNVYGRAGEQESNQHEQNGFPGLDNFSAHSIIQETETAISVQELRNKTFQGTTQTDSSNTLPQFEPTIASISSQNDGQFEPERRGPNPRENKSASNESVSNRSSCVVDMCENDEMNMQNESVFDVQMSKDGQRARRTNGYMAHSDNLNGLHDETPHNQPDRTEGSKGKTTSSKAHTDMAQDTSIVRNNTTQLQSAVSTDTENRESSTWNDSLNIETGIGDESSEAMKDHTFTSLRELAQFYK